MSVKFKQLNPFELKSVVINLLNRINSVSDIQNCLDDIDTLDAQSNKTVLTKLLFKELVNAKSDKIPIVCFLLEHFTEKNELINGYWELLKNKTLSSEIKISILNILREIDADWSYETCEEYLDDAQDIVDENTKQLLNNAIINPETQIDFMDFLHSIKTDDQITLLHSFAQDFSQDALANILIPVFESAPYSIVGKEALKLLAQTKSQLALNLLNRIISRTSGELNSLVKKSLAELKMSGTRVDNTKEFYAQILSNTKPDKFYLTYPDGHGDMAMIFTRITDQNRVRFVSIVVNIDSGIKDCFGFFDISRFECDKILERFLKDERVADISPEIFKTILYNAENTTIEHHVNDWVLPYEYVCWKNLLVDIDSDRENIEQMILSQILPAKVDESIFEKLDDMKINSHWFLDANYSDEFEDLIKDLKNSDDLDKLIDEHFEKVFYPDEKQSWTKKLFMCAYIKYSIGKDDEASFIYGLIKNEELFDEFLKEILKRSMYEYLTTVKYNKEENTHHFTDEEISGKIEYIESKWIK